MDEEPTATIRNIVETLWETPPNHFDAHSKMLVNPATAPTRTFDFRISSYQPKGYVGKHQHRVQEQIYYILDGEGLMELGDERRVMRQHDYVFIPPGLDHAIYNTGLKDLIFFVITAPPQDD